MANTADNAQAKALKKACDQAYVDPQGKSSCSHSVWYVLKAIVNKDEPYREANTLISYLTTSPKWCEVKVGEIGDLANQGVVVIGGKSEPAPHHGHVIVVYPGDPIAGGGYEYKFTNKKTNKVESRIMGSHGMKPPCLSTTLPGGWPGATSDGDKTVLDPWGDVLKFSHVKFWTLAK